MKILRTDKQAALQDLLVGVRETIDLFNDAADHLDHPSLARQLRQIADERQAFIFPLEALVLETDELPAVPDEDRETAKKLISRLFAAVEPNSAGKILLDREKDEAHLNQLISQCRKAGVGGQRDDLLHKLDEHLIRTHQRIQELLTQYQD